MELNTFIAETLKQVVEGVSQAEKDVSELKATINPKGVVIAQTGQPIIQKDRPTVSAQIIEFDISLTETGSSEAGGKIGVFFGNVGMGAQGKVGTGSNATNRVKFSIPVALPSHLPK
ncbi:hypothetical protein ACFLTW_04605 [Chloroflexota bacterium]